MDTDLQGRNREDTREKEDIWDMDTDLQGRNREDILEWNRYGF